MPVDAIRDAKPVPSALLTAATDTLRQLGTRRFSLTAVAEAAGVSRGTVHNLLGTRDNAIATAVRRFVGDHIVFGLGEYRPRVSPTTKWRSSTTGPKPSRHHADSAADHP